MGTIKKRVVALLVALSMVSSLALTACNATDQIQEAANDAISQVAQAIQGDVTGEVGTEYQTQWFTFSVDSMSVAPTYGDYTAAEGNSLVIATITETNTSGQSQAFGTFDWFVDDDSLADYIYPLDPTTEQMMPLDFTLEDGDTVTYDVVIEYPSNLANPFLMYIEADTEGNTYTTFRVPVK